MVRLGRTRAIGLAVGAVVVSAASVLGAAAILQPAAPASSTTTAATSFGPLRLPIASGKSIVVTNGNQDAYDHEAGKDGQFAWDFGEDGNVPFTVVAAAAGIVVDARSDSTVEGCKDVNVGPDGSPDTNCYAEANYILVANDDGKTATLYMHFAPNTVTKRAGDKVCRGEELGVDDMTGFATDIHLHLQVEALPSRPDKPAEHPGWWFKTSQPAWFDDPDVVQKNTDKVPSRNPGTYVSANTSTCSSATPPSAPAPGVSAPPSSPPPTLAGTWVAPTNGAQVKTTNVTLSAKPTASVSDVAITKVVYSVAWSGKPAVEGCTATKAASNGSWSCSADLDKIGAPAGDLTLSFDVFDDAGDVTRSPDGTRKISFAPTPQPPDSAKATMVGPSGNCLTVTAAIDDASRYHLAASCDGRIRYSEFQARGWKTITFQPPSGRLEVGPQLALDGNTLYLAYTRVAPDSGCGGGYADVGVYYRTRSGEGGAWSDPIRIGGSKDELFSLRVSDGVINVTVLRGSDGTDQYETVKGTVSHRYPMSDAYGFVSLRLASNGAARVVYQSSRGIEYGSFNGQAFTRSLIAKQDGYMFGPVLVLDSGSHAHVVWTHAPPPGGCAEPDASPKDGTYYATNKSGSWKVERITRVVGDTSLQVDASGKVYVLVAGASLQEFTRSTSGTWNSETVAKIVADSPVLRRDAATGRSLIAFIEHADAAKRSGVYVIVMR